MDVQRHEAVDDVILTVAQVPLDSDRSPLPAPRPLGAGSGERSKSCQFGFQFRGQSWYPVEMTFHVRAVGQHVVQGAVTTLADRCEAAERERPFPRPARHSALQGPGAGEPDVARVAGEQL